MKDLFCLARRMLPAIWLFTASQCLAKDSNQILFLRLKFSQEGIRVVQTSVKPGRLKTAAAPVIKAPVKVELLNADGASLWHDIIADPRLQQFHLQHGSGRESLAKREVTVAEMECTVRIPFLPAAETVRLSGDGVSSTFAVDQATRPHRKGDGWPVAGTVTQVLTNGPTDKRINIVFLAEGYLASQSNQFATDSLNVLLKIIQTPPFDAYSNYFNAFNIFVASPESGSDHPTASIYKDTYFNSTYDSYGISYLVTIPPHDRDGVYSHGKGKIDALLQELMPEYDISVLIVNDTQYGASGGAPLITSVNAASSEIAVHELGHGFAGLGDEYETPFPGYPEVEEPNTTRETDRASIKWRDWILPATPLPTPETTDYAGVVGLFEGAHYHATGWYRPKLDCKMNHLDVPFCEVCAEAFIKSTYIRVRPIEASFPSTNDVITLTDSETVVLRVIPLEPAAYHLSVQWFINNIAVPAATNTTFTVSGNGISAGTNQVKVKVNDPTPKVRTDPSRILQDQRTWSIHGPGPPTLLLNRQWDKVVLSWAAAATGFTLESKRDLMPETPWIPFDGPMGFDGGRISVTNTVAVGESRFFRLRK